MTNPEVPTKVTNTEEAKMMIAQASEHIEMMLAKNPGKESWLSAFNNLILQIMGDIESAVDSKEISEDEGTRLNAMLKEVGLEANQHKGKDISDDIKRRLIAGLNIL